MKPCFQIWVWRHQMNSKITLSKSHKTRKKTLHTPKWDLVGSYVKRSFWVTWGLLEGYLFDQTQLWYRNRDSASQKPYKKTYYMPKGRFGNRFMIKGHKSITRDHLDKRNRHNIPNYILHAPKGDFLKRVMYVGHYKSLEVRRSHMMAGSPRMYVVHWNICSFKKSAFYLI